MSIPFGLRGKLLLPVLLVCFFMTLSIKFFWDPSMLSHRQNLMIEKEKATLSSISPGIIHLMLSNDIATIHRTLDTVLQINGNTWKAIILNDEKNRRLYPLELKKSFIPEQTIITTHKLMFDDETIGSLVVVLDLTKALRKEPEDVFKLEMIELAFFFLLIGLSIYWQNHLICNPLRRLKEVALQLTQGNFNIQLPKETNDEIGHLTTAFKTMNTNLLNYISKQKTTEKSLQRAYQEMEQRVIERTKELQLKDMAFRNTSEAIVITNSSGEIVDINLKTAVKTTANT